jgi:hypothetical protein
LTLGDSRAGEAAAEDVWIPALAELVPLRLDSKTLG